MSDFGRKQLETIRDFGKYKASLLDGPLGCGKTYSAEGALGYHAARCQAEGLTGLNIFLVGPSVPVIKRNQCNVLSSLYGSNFRYTASTKDGMSKNAVLFGQYIHLIGLDDANAEKRIRGISPLWCVVHDEVTFLRKSDIFDLIMGRLGRDSNITRTQKLADLGLRNGFYVGSTNPDAPTHWVKKGIDSGVMFDNYSHWTMNDASWYGCKEYYADLIKRYSGKDAFFRRYLLGEWTMAEGLVWNAFDNECIIDVIAERIDTNTLNLSGFERVVIGIDWGSKHATSFSVLGSNGDKYICVYNKKYFGLSPSELVIELKKLISKIELSHFINGIYVDGAGKSYNDELSRNNIMYTNAVKDHIYIPTVNAGFYSKSLFILSSCEELIEEIYAYKYKENAIDDAINRVDDDACDSLRYAYITDMKLRGII
jgi:hypothetical protein